VGQTLLLGERRRIKTSKNAVIVSPGRLDRSPCGTGSSARMALLHSRGELGFGEPFTHLSILDTEFSCRIAGTTVVGGIPAVIPTVTGRAWLTGISCYGVDPEDPFPQGYRLDDTWFGC
jgi:proline racemase